MMPRRCWLPACWSSELRGRRPFGAELLGAPLALFRDEAGVARALSDRCAHRGFPLSAGRVEPGGIRCAYHGWLFDGSGSCRGIPALAGTEAPDRPERRVSAREVREAGGVAWAWGDSSGAEGLPPRIDMDAGPGALSLRWSFDLDASVADAAENVLDVPHTAFLHGGIFRVSGAAREIEVAVRRTADRIEAEYLGEPAPSGALGRLLAPGGGAVTHVDRFVMPSIAQVEYGLGRRARLVATTHLVPEGDARTRGLHVLSLAPRALAIAALPLLAPLAWWVLRQDSRALAVQSLSLARAPGFRFASTEADVLGPHVRQMLEREASGLAPLPDAAWSARIRI